MNYQNFLQEIEKTVEKDVANLKTATVRNAIVEALFVKIVLRNLKIEDRLIKEVVFFTFFNCLGDYGIFFYHQEISDWWDRGDALDSIEIQLDRPITKVVTEIGDFLGDCIQKDEDALYMQKSLLILMRFLGNRVISLDYPQILPLDTGVITLESAHNSENIIDAAIKRTAMGKNSKENYEKFNSLFRTANMFTEKIDEDLREYTTFLENEILV